MASTSHTILTEEEAIMTHHVDNTMDHVLFLADERLKGRVPGSEGNRVAREYIMTLFERLQLHPAFGNGKSYVQEINTGGDLTGSNVGGYIKGTTGKFIIVGAHYDHIAHSPGADDNAAAVAQVLSTATYFASKKIETKHNIMFLAFDCEEPPYFLSDRMGSVFFYEHCPVPRDRIELAIILDLTGHAIKVNGLGNRVFVLGTEYSSDLLDAVHLASEQIPILKPFCTRNDRVGDLSDHHVFRANGKPFLFLSCGRTEHYHSSSDTVENLDMARLCEVKDFLVALVIACDGKAPFSMDHARGTFKEVEARQLAEVLGKEVPLDEVDGTIAMLRGRL